MFAKGDYVMYEKPYGQPELGRVTAQPNEDMVFVCYHEGCTAALTDAGMLRKATKEEVRSFPGASRLGFHRFDRTCPKRSEECCDGCDAKLG